MILHSVLLPQPLEPIEACTSPGFERKLRAGERDHASELLADTARLQDGHRCGILWRASNRVTYFLKYSASACSGVTTVLTEI